MNFRFSSPFSNPVKSNVVSFAACLLLCSEVIVNNYIFNISLAFKVFCTFLFLVCFFVYYGRISIYSSVICLLMIVFYFIIQATLQHGIFGFLNIIVAAVLGITVARGLIPSKHMLFLVFILICTVTLKALSLFLIGEPFATISNNIALGASRNLISISLIFLTTVYYLITLTENKKIITLPALLCLTFVILAGGRSGIVSASFLYIFVAFLSLKNECQVACDQVFNFTITNLSLFGNFL